MKGRVFLILLLGAVLLLSPAARADEPVGQGQAKKASIEKKIQNLSKNKIADKLFKKAVKNALGKTTKAIKERKKARKSPETEVDCASAFAKISR